MAKAKKHVVAFCPVCRVPVACYQQTSRLGAVLLRPYRHTVLRDESPMAPGVRCRGCLEWKTKSEMEIVEEAADAD